jgi:tetratricopeptide (TPR) repeat protein
MDTSPASPTAAAQRALVLQQQGRYADAEREWRQVLGWDPHDARAHAMLALCLTERKAYAEASYEADAAVGLLPDEPFAHYVRGRVLYDRNEYDQAAEAVGQAIRLEAFDPAYFWLLAAIRFEQRRWSEALAAAEEGLKADPEHAGCTNLRAMALVKLGRRDEAGAAIDAALARDPDNAVTHANQGWTLLHRGEPRKALDHFREALRINPGLEWARQGMVEALKAQNFIYRWMLMYFLWMGRLSRRAQWGIIIGGYVGYRALFEAARQNSKLAPYLWPVVGAYAAFVLMTWLADPLFNLMLRLSRFGRLVLSRTQAMAANVVGLLLAGALAAAGAWLWRGDPRLGILAIVLGAMMLPTSAAFNTQTGWPRLVMALTAAALGVFGLAAVGLAYLLPFDDSDVGNLLAGLDLIMLRLFALGLLGSTFLYNYLRTVTVRQG